MSLKGSKNFIMNKDLYNDRFLCLLKKIYQHYNILMKNEKNIPRDENLIRNLLVDKYLSDIDEFEFKKEEKNNQGRVDIYITEKIDSNVSKPQFIIECKLLNNKKTTGMTGLNAEYIKNGIYRFLTEYYFIDNQLYTNAMIGFITEKVDIDKNIISLNSLSKILLKNLIDITQKIELHEENIYKSNYYSCTKKDFTVYHLMMDFTK